MTKALALPSTCHVSAPSVCNCDLSVGTGAAPGLSPLLAPTSPVAGTPTAGGGGISANDVSPVSVPTSSLLGSSALTSISAVLSTLLLTVVSFALF